MVPIPQNSAFSHGTAMCWWLDGGAQADTSAHHKNGHGNRFRFGFIDGGGDVKARFAPLKVLLEMGSIRKWMGSMFVSYSAFSPQKSTFFDE